MEPYIQIVLMVADGLLTLVVGWAGWKLHKYRNREEERARKEQARDNLQLAVARAMLIRECNHYVAKGYAPLYALDSVNEMYQAYHALGGNGAVTGIYQEFLHLPHNQKGDSREQVEFR